MRNKQAENGPVWEGTDGTNVKTNDDENRTKKEQLRCGFGLGEIVRSIHPDILQLCEVLEM